MKNISQHSARAFSILHSLPILVFILFLINRIDLSFLFIFGSLAVFLTTACLNIYVMSGISGCLLEIISSEEIVFQFRRFHQNVKVFWQGFLIAYCIICFLDFLFFVYVPSLRAWQHLFFATWETIAIFLLVQWTIKKKYIQPLGIPHRGFKVSLNFLLVMTLVFLVELIMVRLIEVIPNGAFQWKNVFFFGINYIHVFEFIFISMNVLEGYPEVYEKFSASKEIYLINPMNAGIIYSLAFWCLRGFPPAFVVLKALSPKSYKFREFNKVIWHDRYYKNNVLVCITCFTSNCYEAYKIAKEFKKRGSTVIMGGPHVTYLPEEALAFCDSVVVGQAEGVWGDLITDYENGTLKPKYSGTADEFDHLKVHEELLNSPPHVIKEFLETSRGCKFRCHFCTIPALSNGQMYLQSTTAIVELIKKIKPSYNSVSFIDNNIYSDPGYAKELFLALKPLKIKWNSQCTIDIAKNQETLKLARESGCNGLLFGYEVSGGSLEKNQGGKFAMAHKYREYTQIIKKQGIRIKGHFIFGFDSDNFKSLFQLWKFCFSIMPKFTIVSLLTPLPGSVLYQEMLAQDRIINLNWRNYAMNRMVFRHPQMDHHLASFFFPLLQPLFMMTTSTLGFILLAIVLVFFRL